MSGQNETGDNKTYQFDEFPEHNRLRSFFQPTIQDKDSTMQLSTARVSGALVNIESVISIESYGYHEITQEDPAVRLKINYGLRGSIFIRPPNRLRLPCRAEILSPALCIQSNEEQHSYSPENIFPQYFPGMELGGRIRLRTDRQLPERKDVESFVTHVMDRALVESKEFIDTSRAYKAFLAAYMKND